MHICIISSWHTILTQGDEIVKTNPRIVETVTVSVVITAKIGYSKRKGMGGFQD